MLVAMCMVAMVTMATVNNKPRVIMIEPTASTAVQSTTTVADLTYVLAKNLSNL